MYLGKGRFVRLLTQGPGAYHTFQCGEYGIFMGHYARHGMCLQNFSWFPPLLETKLGTLIGECEGRLSDECENNLGLITYDAISLIYKDGGQEHRLPS